MASEYHRKMCAWLHRRPALLPLRCPTALLLSELVLKLKKPASSWRAVALPLQDPYLLPPSSMISTPTGAAVPSSAGAGSVIFLPSSSIPGSFTDATWSVGAVNLIPAPQLDHVDGLLSDAEHQKVFLRVCGARRTNMVKAAVILEVLSKEEALIEEPDKCVPKAAIILRVP